jgi:hypothetical protein
MSSGYVTRRYEMAGRSKSPTNGSASGIHGKYSALN